MEASTVGAVVEATRRALQGKGAAARPEAQLLVAEAAGRSRAWVLTHPEAALPLGQRRALADWLVRYLGGQPLPYVLGWWEFYGRRFLVTPHVLIPRPETEGVAEAGLEFLRRRGRPARILDVGTGSGCLAVTLAAEFGAAEVLASDLSHAALRVAVRNAERHGVRDRVRFVQADLVPPTRARADLLVANLPYVPRSRLARLEVARAEPKLALDGGRRGLELIGRLLDLLPEALAAGGRAILEIDAGQGRILHRMLRRRFQSWKLRVAPDLTGRDRYVILDRPD